MTSSPNKPSDTYSPLYFLTSLGAGGLTVTFFMWLMHWTRHPGRPVPVFSDIMAAFAAGGILMRVMIIAAVIIQLVTMRLVVILNRKHFGRPSG